MVRCAAKFYIIWQNAYVHYAANFLSQVNAMLHGARLVTLQSHQQIDGIWTHKYGYYFEIAQTYSSLFLIVYLHSLLLLSLFVLVHIMLLTLTYLDWRHLYDIFPSPAEMATPGRQLYQASRDEDKLR